MERSYERLLGTGLVALGVGILLFGLLQAYAFGQHPPGSTTSKGPDAAFSWSVSGFSVTFTDRSSAGSSPINKTYWNFGDGNSTYATNTSHTYTSAGTHNVTLEVDDQDGNLAASNGQVTVGLGASGTGQGSPSFSPGSNVSSVLNSLGLGGAITNIVKTVEMLVAFVIEVVVGGAILRAGWNLITPKAETISIRVKPRSLQVEPVGPPTPWQPGPSASAPAEAPKGPE